jgi:hypothetical protein
MLKRRSTWLAASGSLLLILSLSGLVAGAEPPATEPVVAVDTTATYEDIDGNGIDDDCQAIPAVDGDPAVVAAELAAVDVDANGIISTTEAAHSARIGGKNCNHGGYVSWIAHQKGECTEVPPVVEPTVAETVELVVTTPPDAEPDRVEVCETDVTPAIAGAKKDKVAAAAARDASKAERKLAHQAAKAERAAAKAERTAAREASKAERNAARDAKKAAHAAKHKSH